MIVTLVFDENGIRKTNRIEIENVVKLHALVTLFQDVSINDMICTDRGRLGLAVLTNKLETTPLAMLIDELQTTQEYLEKSKHHPKYRDMWNLLITIGKSLSRQPDFIVDKRSLRLIIGRLLAPCKECNATGFKEEKTSIVLDICPHCTDGYESDLFTGSTNKTKAELDSNNVG